MQSMPRKRLKDEGGKRKANPFILPPSAFILSFSGLYGFAGTLYLSMSCCIPSVDPP